MDNVLDFIILEQVYKDSLKRQWSSGDRFQSLIDDQCWSGTILKQSPFSEDTPDSVWQMYHIKWDNEITNCQVSPWEILPINADTIYTHKSEWADTRDANRILCGLELILKDGVFKEANDFLYQVDYIKETAYCTVVAFPTSISTIAERLRNGLYRYQPL